MTQKPDFLHVDHGSIHTLRGLTPEALLWMEDNLPEDFGGVVEARYIDPILEGIQAEGLTFQ